MRLLPRSVEQIGQVLLSEYDLAVFILGISTFKVRNVYGSGSQQDACAIFSHRVEANASYFPLHDQEIPSRVSPQSPLQTATQLG